MADDILDRFFSQARDVGFNEIERIELSPSDIAALVSNDAIRARFVVRFQKEAQSFELRALIRICLKSLASKEAELADELRIDANGIDAYVGRVGIGATGGGIAMVVAATGGVGGGVLLGGGLIAMAVSGVTANRMRKWALKHEMTSRRISDLIEELGDD